MSSGSNTKYSWMSDVEFLRVAEGVVGMEVLEEALHRLSVRLNQDADHAAEIVELEITHSDEIDDKDLEIGRLEARLDQLESSSEYA